MHHNKLLALLALLTLLTATCRPTNSLPQTTAGNPLPPDTAQLIRVHDFGANPGNLTMYKYVPPNMPDDISPDAPLVVSLHGCKQSAAIYAQNGWLDLADQWQFYLLFPEQSWWNMYNRCWSWFRTGDNQRGEGEAQSIRNMVEQMLTDHAIDEERIFVEGLSAGGYMAANLLAAYPDRFTAGGISAGGPAYCALSIWSAWPCMHGGADYDPTLWGDLVENYGYSVYGAWPRVSIWQGTADTTVDPMNQQELVEQWTTLHGIDQIVDQSDMVQGYPHHEYHGGAGTVLVETYTIPGMAHGVAVDPGFAPANGCGSATGYLLDADICTVYYLGRFFGLDPGNLHLANGPAPTGRRAVCEMQILGKLSWQNASTWRPNAERTELVCRVITAPPRSDSAAAPTAL